MLRASGDFPGGPMVQIPHSQCRRPGFISGQGTKIPHAAWCCQKIYKNTKTLISKKKKKELLEGFLSCGVTSFNLYFKITLPIV